MRHESFRERNCHAARQLARITVAAADQALAAAVVEETGTGLPCGVPSSLRNGAF